VSADGGRTCATVGCAGTAAAGSFKVTGAAGYSYSVALPAGSITLTESAAGTATMTVGSFTAASASGTETLNADGADTLTVGAALDVGANQAVGSYSGRFEVTVDYQ
jgi:hypothetical protein